MVDTLTEKQRSWNMSRVRGKDTKPELLVRSVLHRTGYRFRLHAKGLPGKPDIVLAKHHAVIFVHGCFWHRHKRCPDATVPKTRSVFDRYNIVNEADLERAAQSMTAYFEREKAKMVTLSVTPAKVEGGSNSSASCKEVESSANFLELARGIEPPTCGLQNRCSAIELRQPE